MGYPGGYGNKSNNSTYARTYGDGDEACSNNNFLPVLDDGGVLLGLIDITRIRHIIFRTELYKRFKVRQLMLQPSAVLGENEPMDEVMAKFDKTDAAQLPVVDVQGVLVGYINRTKVYSVYRQIVADMSAE